ncbi:MAG: HAMP domain-containing protein [Flavobacteriales bacterium]|nr:HAMP domain-containing protein [Flavobacteriales bacterium]
MTLSIRKRLTLGTLFLFALLLLSSGIGIYQLDRLKTDAKTILTDNYESIRYVQAMQEALYRNDPVAFREQLDLQEGNATEVREAEFNANLRMDFENWNGASDQVGRLHTDLTGILRVNLDAINRKNEAALATAKAAEQRLWVIGALTLVVGLAFSLAFPRLITEPIGRLRIAVEQVAKGNYRHRIPMFRGDELGALATSFNDMSAQLEQWENSNLALIMTEKSRVEAILNSMVNAAFGVDHEGRIIFANLKAVELLGLSEAELIGRTTNELVARNDLLRYVLADGESRPFKAVVGGKEQFFTSSHAPIRSAKGDLGTVHLLHNITPFQERDEARTHFLATISHELKTPLASTDLGLGLLENSKRMDEQQRAILEDLRKDHQRLVRIVSELLDLTQIETGRIRVALGDHALSGIVHKAVSALHTAADAKQVRIDVHLEPEDLLVHADTEKASWALINLLSNAVRHSPQAGLVALTTRKEGSAVLLSVTDQGAGLTDQQQAHLFERFNPHASSGSGLGLSIARDFMRAMNGDISLTASTANGSVFTIRFAGAPTA